MKIPELWMLVGSLGMTLANGVAAAQTTTAARLVAIRPRSDGPFPFEEGYKRHLDWHRAHHDSWTWLGWMVVTGDRLGCFVDGTFGRAFAELDHPVDPAGDREDLGKNVVPAGQFLTQDLLVERKELSTATDSSLTSPLLALVTLELLPGRLESFTRFAAPRLHARGQSIPSIWYERRSGGATPALLVMIPLRGWSEAARLDGDAPWISAESTPAVRAAWTTILESSVRASRVEMLQWRRDLSLLPDRAAP